MTDIRTWQGRFYEGSNFNLLARVVGLDNLALNQNDFAAPGGTPKPIQLTIYESSNQGGAIVYQQTFERNAVQFTSQGTQVPTISSTLLTGYGWPDSTGFNFCINVAAGDWTTQAIGGQLYLAEAELTTLGDSGVVYVIWKVRCLPVRS